MKTFNDNAGRTWTVAINVDCIKRVKALLDVMEIKAFCSTAGIAQIDAGPKGGVLQFRNDQFAKPEGLVDFMQRSRGAARLQPDHKLVYKADWRVRDEKGELRIIDVMVEGLSMAVTQRSEFSSVARKSGIDGLLQSLRENIARLDEESS